MTVVGYEGVVVVDKFFYTPRPTTLLVDAGVEGSHADRATIAI